MLTILPSLSIVFLVIAVALFVFAYKQKLGAGIPPGKVIYTDTSRWGKVEKPLFDPALRLTGKPDYLVQRGEQIIPVEVKSGRIPQSPYDSHIYQLAAYCLLAWTEYGHRPDHGLIHYPGRTFAVDFTPALEQAVRFIIEEMQMQNTRIQVDRSHEEPQRCTHCGYRSICDQSLRI